MIILIVMLALVIEALILITWQLKARIKENEYFSKLLAEENKKLRDALLEKIANTTVSEAKEVLKEATITKEPDDAPDDIYNLILQQWIYGATEDKEGGIDG